MVDVMSIVQKLKDPKFARKVDDRIVNFLNNEYLKLGTTPPLPKFTNGSLYYTDKKVMRLVERYRTGALILAQMLDQEKAENDKRNH